MKLAQSIYTAHQKFIHMMLRHGKLPLRLLKHHKAAQTWLNNGQLKLAQKINNVRWDFYPHDAKTSNNMAVSEIKQYHTLKPMLVETHVSVWKVIHGTIETL